MDGYRQPKNEDTFIDRQSKPNPLVREGGTGRGDSSTKVLNIGRTDGSRSRKQKQVVCRYYMLSSCKFGEKCKFYHPRRRSPSSKSEDSKEKPASEEDVQSRRSASELNLGMFLKTAETRPPVARPESVKCKTSDGLLQVELEQLRARFPGDKSTVVEKGKHGVVYRITFTPTDPDWIFDFKNVDLLVDLPRDYPLKPLSVVVPDDQTIPKECVKEINSAIMEWLAAQVSGALMLRPFLHWLDRVITMLVQDSIPKDADAAASQVLPTVDVATTEGSETKDEVDEELKASDGHEKALATLAVKRGTEIRLKDLMLSQYVATVVFPNVKLVAECTRCKNNQDLTVTAENPVSSDCSRCHTCMSATFHSCLIHAGSITMGYMDLVGCAAVDVIMMDSNVTITCLECGKENTSKGFCYGQPKDVWCRRCHSKLTVSAEQCKFVQHQTRELLQTAHAAPKHAKLKRKELVLKQGTPLPDYGTCQHYKKSHRWLRFPCCGKAYACDVCHDSKEDHPMERANRMICGYCSKEQVYTTSKPCTLCGFNLAVVKHSAFWEGGQGCRDKAKMSRNDRRKFTQSSDKTTSKHFERVGPQAKKS